MKEISSGEKLDRFRSAIYAYPKLTQLAVETQRLGGILVMRRGTSINRTRYSTVLRTSSTYDIRYAHTNSFTSRASGKFFSDDNKLR